MNFSTDKKQLIFYEKTGCAGNARQKDELKKEGITFEVRSMLEFPWTKQSLLPFFENLSIDEIYNPFAPAIKNNEIKINDYSKDELIELMIKDPILIKRPLIEIGSHKICGFDMAKINSILKTNLNADANISTCQSSDSCKSV